MTLIHLFAVIGILLTLAGYMGIRNKNLGNLLTKHSLLLLFACALFLRLFIAALSEGFGSDTACFAAWADRMYNEGPGGFYSPDVFTDYPPGYMYILWGIGAIRNLFHIEYYSTIHLILLKTPAILCDLGLGALIYMEGMKLWATDKISSHDADAVSHAKKRNSTTHVIPPAVFFLCLIFLFHPSIIINSSVWGQVDSIFTLCVVATFLLVMREKMFPAYIVYAIGILIKPQTLLFSPVLLAGIIDYVFMKEFTVKKLIATLLQGITAIVGMLLLALPFGFTNVLKQYFSTVTSYPYAAVNACNFWGMLGLNWSSQDNTFLGVPIKLVGTLVIVLAIAVVLYLSILNKKDSRKYPFLGAFLVLTIFVFSVRMHERYMYPAMVLLLLAYLYKPAKEILICFGGFAAMHFYNVAWVLFYYDPYNYSAKNPALVIPSAGMLLCAGLLYFITHRYYRGAKSKNVTVSLGCDTTASNTARISKAAPGSVGTRFKALGISSVTKKSGKAANTKNNIRPSRPKDMPFTKVEFLTLATITLLYSCVTLYDLGDMDAPSTAYEMVQNDTILLHFEESPASMSHYIAPWQNRVFKLEGHENITLKSVFTWQTITLPENLTQIALTLTDTQASILELVFTDAEGNVVTPTNAADYPELFDEADLYPEVSSFRNSMYFDEIYHGRTAYEFVNGLTSYENTHPPLGKVFIALGVIIFGMNPFGWRIAGAFFGILMVPLTYLFVRKLTKNVPIATLGCILFTFDFMHFTQTRIATIDVYITFFVLAMYYFMYQYCTMSFYDTPLKKTFLPLGACGICMGLGVASKWTGVYAGIGLALIFFYTLYQRYREYIYALKIPNRSSNGISHAKIIDSFLPNTKRTIAFCLVFFVAVPLCIYALSYIPFRDYSDRGLIDRILYNQETMFNYHSTLNSTHPYSSLWYQWPIMTRPTWYYSNVLTGAWGEGGMREGISAFGNPAVWWIGIPAALYMVYLLIRKKDRKAAFLLVGYLAQYLPWFFVTRVTFIYHYFPSVVFVVLMISYSLLQLKEHIKSQKVFVGMLLAYGALTIALFILFYPVLSGQPIDAEFVTTYLRWFDTWVLTAS